MAKREVATVVILDCSDPDEIKPPYYGKPVARYDLKDGKVVAQALTEEGRNLLETVPPFVTNPFDRSSDRAYTPEDGELYLRMLLLAWAGGSYSRAYALDAEGSALSARLNPETKELEFT